MTDHHSWAMLIQGETPEEILSGLRKAVDKLTADFFEGEMDKETRAFMSQGELLISVQPAKGTAFELKGE